MNPHDQSTTARWERELDRRLKNLPDRPAPADLAPRVLAAIAARAQAPWYRRPWTRWPRSVQVFSLAVTSFLLGSLTYAILHFPDLAAGDGYGRQLDTWMAPVRALWDAAVVVVGVIGGLLSRVSTWVWCVAGAVCAVMYLTCIGLGTVFYRLAFHK